MNVVGNRNMPTSKGDSLVDSRVVFLFNGSSLTNDDNSLTNGCFANNANSDGKSHSVINRRSTVWLVSSNACKDQFRFGRTWSRTPTDEEVEGLNERRTRRGCVLLFGSPVAPLLGATLLL